MATIDIILPPGMIFEDPIGFDLSVLPADGANGIFWPRNNAAETAHNYAGGTVATVIGLPEYRPQSAILSDENYIDTGILETEEMTMLCCARRKEAPYSLMSTYLDGGSAKFTSLRSGINSPWPYVGSSYGTTNGSAVSTSGAIPNGEMDVVALTVGAGGFTVHRPASNEAVSSGVALTRILNNQTVKIGYVPAGNSTYVGRSAEIAFAAIWPRVLSGAEINAMHAFLKRRAGAA